MNQGTRRDTFPILPSCSPADLEVLQEVSLEIYREAFAAQNHPGDFETYLRDAFSMKRLRRERHIPGFRTGTPLK